MLEVGKERWPVEDRTHFGAWCITSSPLILGYDLTKEKITDRVWHIITNEDAIAVNPAWGGSPGYFVRDFAPDPQAKQRDIKKGDYQVFSKPEDFENYRKYFKPKFRLKSK